MSMEIRGFLSYICYVGPKSFFGKIPNNQLPFSRKHQFVHLHQIITKKIQEVQFLSISMNVWTTKKKRAKSYLGQVGFYKAFVQNFSRAYLVLIGRIGDQQDCVQNYGKVFVDQVGHSTHPYPSNNQPL